MISNFILFDLYLKQLLIYEFFEKFLKKTYIKNIGFKYMFINIKYFFFNFEILKWIYSKIFYIIRHFIILFNYKIYKKCYMSKYTKKLQFLYYKGGIYNYIDFYFMFDFFRFFFCRIYLKYNQLIGISYFLIKKFNQQKIKKKLLLFCNFYLYLNDLNFRLNHINDALLKKNVFIYFYENFDLLYEFFFFFFGIKKILYIYMSFLGYYFFTFYKFLQKFKNFMSYTILI